MGLHRPLTITPASLEHWLAAMRRAIADTLGARDPELGAAMGDALAQMAAGMAPRPGA